jgi:ATP/maltotriose-dependent transcriptional regulator MalT
MGYLQLGQIPEAEAALQEMTTAMGNGESAMDPRYRGLAETLHGLLQLRRGDPAAALDSANAALAAIGAPAKGSGREARASLELAANAALALDRSVDAERFARQELHIAEAVARGPDTSADVGEALLLLAKAEIAQGRAAEAQPLLDRAVRCLTNGLGKDHDQTREALALVPANRA